MSTYAFSYDENTVYSHVIGLVRQVARPGVVVDLGCGWGAVAEPLRELGLDYLGLDIEGAGLRDLRQRGFGAAAVDLRDEASVRAALLGGLDGRPVAAFLALDVLEHLTEPEQLLELLHGWDDGRGAPLVVSVPNVAHYDLAAKLLLGRWDVTPTGLLDRTHVSLFTERRLSDTMAAVGWVQTAADDFPLADSDQRFPELPVFSRGAPLHDLLARLRDSADAYGQVNQFVRAYLPGRSRESARDTPDGAAQPFLTVLTRTQGRRLETLEDLLACWLGQTDQDFELLLLCHGADASGLAAVRATVAALPASLATRTTVVEVPSGGGRARPLNVGLARARGRYVAVVDDDDLVLAHYVAEFHALAERCPGEVLRARVATQAAEGGIRWPHGETGHAAVGRTRQPYPEEWTFLEHLDENRTPFCGLAFPMGAVRSLGLAFDEDLPVLEDYEFQMRTAILCGVASTPEGTSIYRRWTGGEHSGSVHAVSEWQAARRIVTSRFDAQPVILPAGAFLPLRELIIEKEKLERKVKEVARERDQARRRVRQMTESTSWKVTGPLRSWTDRAKSVRRRRPAGGTGALDGGR